MIRSRVEQAERIALIALICRGHRIATQIKRAEERPLPIYALDFVDEINAAAANSFPP